MLKKYLSISLSIFMLANYIPVNCFAQSADFVTQDSKLIVPRINYGGADLIEESQKIYERLMELYDGDMKGDMIFFRSQDRSLSKVEELKSILEDYKKFLIHINNSQKVLKGVESGKISSLEMLTEKYFAEVPDYTQNAILDRFGKSNNVTYFYSYKESVWEIQEEVKKDIKIINDIIDVRAKVTATKSKGVLNKDYFADIKNICRKYVSYLKKENYESVKAIYEGFERNAAKIFATPESKAEFLRYIWDKTIEIMEKNDPDFKEKLLRGLVLHEGDTPKVIINKLQQVLRRLGREAPKHIKDSLKRMIKYIDILCKEGKLEEYIAKTNNELTLANKRLIKDIEEFGGGKNTMFSDILLQDAASSIPERTTVRTAGRVLKLVTPAMIILGTIWTVNTIVNIDTGNNTFANTMNPITITKKIKNGTASKEELFAYYMMPYSAKYIEEQPLQFASVMFFTAEVVTNPDIEKFMNDAIMQIKNLGGFKDIGLNDKLDEEIDRALNKIEISGLELPRT